MAVRLSFRLHDPSGNPLVGARVEAFAAGTLVPVVASTTTDDLGDWELELPDGRYDVRVIYGTGVIWHTYADEYSFRRLNIGVLEATDYIVEPRYTTEERDRLVGIPEGTEIWNSTTSRPNWWTGSAWHEADGGTAVGWEYEGGDLGEISTINLVGSGVSVSLLNGVLTVRIEGGTPTPTGTYYAALRETDANFTAADFTGDSGVGVRSRRIMYASWDAGMRYLALGQPVSEDEWTDIRLLGSPVNARPSFPVQPDTVTINGIECRIYVFDSRLLQAASGLTMMVA